MEKPNQKPDWIVVITCLAVCVFILVSFLIEPEILKIQNLTGKLLNQSQEQEKTITMIFVGDIM